MSRPFYVYLLLTAFVTGASVLCIELLGARVLAPFFGSGISTWSALITITMAALALGYAWGGALADRSPGNSLLYLLIFFGAVWCIFTPHIATTVIPSVITKQSFNSAVLLASFILVFPSLFILSTVSPFIIRLTVQQKEKVGITTGQVFAISTIGSLFGALLTGFILVPAVAVSSGFLLVAITLFFISITGQLVGGEKRTGVMLIVISSILVSCATIIKPTKLSSARLIDQLSGYYGQVQVIEKDNSRVLLVDGVGQNYVSTGNVYTTAYINFISALPLIHQVEHTKDQFALVIGLGAGQIPMNYTLHGIKTDVVELDKSIVTMAKKHFGFNLPGERVHVMDGRVYLQKNNKVYDYLVIDAFISDQVAWHLLSAEALIKAKQRVSPSGLLAINMVSEPGAKDIASIQLTLQHVFPFVKIYAYTYQTGLASHIILASARPINLSVEHANMSTHVRKDVVSFLNYPVALLAGGVILRDDYNTLDQMRRDLNQQWRKSMWTYLGEENLGFLLN